MPHMANTILQKYITEQCFNYLQQKNYKTSLN